MNSISLQDMITIMDRGETFAISFRTYDAHKKKGGELIEITQACKHNYALRNDRKNTSTTTASVFKKNPNHYENSTRNIRVLANGNIIKVHLRLITHFNNQIVL